MYIEAICNHRLIIKMSTLVIHSILKVFLVSVSVQFDLYLFLRVRNHSIGVLRDAQVTICKERLAKPVISTFVV